MFHQFLVCFLVSCALGDFLPKHTVEWWLPIPDDIHHSDWLSVLRRSAVLNSPTANSVHGLIRKTLHQAETEGIKGADLAKAARIVSNDVITILSADSVKVDLQQIESDLKAVKPDIMSLGSLNADLALWDGLAYLLEHVKEPDNIHTVLAAVKMVSDSILSEIPNPSATVVYTHVPYRRPEATD